MLAFAGVARDSDIRDAGVRLVEGRAGAIDIGTGGSPDTCTSDTGLAQRTLAPSTGSAKVDPNLTQFLDATLRTSDDNLVMEGGDKNEFGVRIDVPKGGALRKGPDSVSGTFQKWKDAGPKLVSLGVQQSYPKCVDLVGHLKVAADLNAEIRGI